MISFHFRYNKRKERKEHRRETEKQHATRRVGRTGKEMQVMPGREVEQSIGRMGMKKQSEDVRRGENFDNIKASVPAEGILWA